MINATGNRNDPRNPAPVAPCAAHWRRRRCRFRRANDPARLGRSSRAASRSATLRTAQANDAAWARNISLGIALTGASRYGVMRTVSDLMVARAGIDACRAPIRRYRAADRATLWQLKFTRIADEIDALGQTKSVARSAAIRQLAVATASCASIATSHLRPCRRAPSCSKSAGAMSANIVRDAATAISARQRGANGSFADR